MYSGAFWMPAGICAASITRPKKRKLALADSGDARRLQDHARGAGALGLAHEGDLLLGGLAEHGD